MKKLEQQVFYMFAIEKMKRGRVVHCVISAEFFLLLLRLTFQDARYGTTWPA